MEKPPGLIYGVDDRPPLPIFVLAALQLVAVTSNSLVYPILIARAAGLGAEPLLDFISLAMVAMGVGTVLFCRRAPFGSGYLCPAGFSSMYLAPSLYALQTGGLALVFGMTMVAGALQVVLAPLLGRLRPVFPPEIVGLIIAIVGLSMNIIGVRYGLEAVDGGGFGVRQLVIWSVSLTVMVVLHVWTSGLTKTFCVLIGMAAGVIASLTLGDLDAAAIPESGLAMLHVPSPGYLFWSFDLALLAPFLVAAVATNLKITGDVSTCEKLNDAAWVRPDMRSLSGGAVAGGLSNIVSGLVGSCGLNPYSGGIGLSGAVGITSRNVAYGCGIILALLALTPPAALVFAIMPPPVIGAAVFFLAAFVFINGLQIITSRMLDARKTLVVGFSFAGAVMADVFRDAFAAVPPAFAPITGSPLVFGVLCAVVLNLIMRIGVRQRETLRFEPGTTDREAVEDFLAQAGSRWAARRDVVQRAMFGLIQVLEVVGRPSGPVEIVASFDEFNLDLHVGYVGTPILIPERRPTPREILMSEAGEASLAGYLLRQSADRISVNETGGRVDVHLHYDH